MALSPEEEYHLATLLVLIAHYVSFGYQYEASGPLFSFTDSSLERRAFAECLAGDR